MDSQESILKSFLVYFHDLFSDGKLHIEDVDRYSSVLMDFNDFGKCDVERRLETEITRICANDTDLNIYWQLFTYVILPLLKDSNRNKNYFLEKLERLYDDIEDINTNLASYIINYYFNEIPDAIKDNYFILDKLSRKIIVVYGNLKFEPKIQILDDLLDFLLCNYKEICSMYDAEAELTETLVKLLLNNQIDSTKHDYHWIYNWIDKDENIIHNLFKIALQIVIPQLQKKTDEIEKVISNGLMSKNQIIHKIAQIIDDKIKNQNKEEIRHKNVEKIRKEFYEKPEKIFQILDELIRNIADFFPLDECNEYFYLLVEILEIVPGLDVDTQKFDSEKIDIIAFLFSSSTNALSREYAYRCFQINDRISPSFFSMIIKMIPDPIRSHRLVYNPIEMTEITDVISTFEKTRVDLHTIYNSNNNRVNYMAHFFLRACKKSPTFLAKAKTYFDSIRHYSSTIFAYSTITEMYQLDKYLPLVGPVDLAYRSALANIPQSQQEQVIDALSSSSLPISDKISIMQFFVQRITPMNCPKALKLMLTLQAPFRKVYINNLEVTFQTEMFLYVLLKIINKIPKLDANDIEILQCYDFLRIRAVRNIKQRVQINPFSKIEPHNVMIFKLLINMLIKLSDNFKTNQILTGFFSIAQLIETVPLSVALKFLHPYFRMMDKRKTKIVRMSISAIPLKQVSSIYVTAVLALNYYTAASNQNGPMWPLLLAIIACNGRYVFVDDLEPLLSDILWDGKREKVPSLEVFSTNDIYYKPGTRRNTTYAIKPTFSISSTLDPVVLSNYFAKRLAHQSEEMIHAAMIIITSASQRTHIIQLTLEVLEPWIENIKLTNSDQCARMFEPLFRVQSQKIAQQIIIKSVFSRFLNDIDQQHIILSSISEHGFFDADGWLMILRTSPHKQKVIEHVVKHFLIPEDTIDYLNIIDCFYDQFPDLISDSYLLIAVSLLMNHEDTTVIHYIMNILNSLFADQDDVEKYLNKVGDERPIASYKIPAGYDSHLHFFLSKNYHRDTTHSAIRLLLSATTSQSIHKLLDFLKTAEIHQENKDMLLEVSRDAVRQRHPYSEQIIEFTLNHGNDQIKQFAQQCFKTNSHSLCRTAYRVLDKKVDAESIVRCVTRGLIPMEALLDNDCGYWTQIVKSEKITELPSKSSLNAAIIFGDEKLVEKIAGSIQDLLNLKFDFSEFRSTIFDLNVVNFVRMRKIITLLPLDLRKVPKIREAKESNGIEVNSIEFLNLLSQICIV